MMITTVMAILFALGGPDAHARAEGRHLASEVPAYCEQSLYDWHAGDLPQPHLSYELRPNPNVEPAEFKADFVSAQRIFVRNMNVPEALKKQGASYAWVEMLMDDYPQIMEVEATLMFDNNAAFREALAKTGDEMQALFTTPFYKTFAKQGFRHVVSMTVETSTQIHLVLSRRSAN